MKRTILVILVIIISLNVMNVAMAQEREEGRSTSSTFVLTDTPDQPEPGFGGHLTDGEETARADENPPLEGTEFWDLVMEVQRKGGDYFLELDDDDNVIGGGCL